MQAQLEKDDISSETTTLVACLKTLGRVAGDKMKHIDYYHIAVELMKVFVSFKLQVSKIDLTTDAIFKNDVKHSMLFQVCAFYLNFIDLDHKLKTYSETHAGMHDDDSDILSYCSAISEPLLPLLNPEPLIDAIRQQCAQYDLQLQRARPGLAKTAGHLFAGGDEDWKKDFGEDAQIGPVMEKAMSVLPTVIGKVLRKELDNVTSDPRQNFKHCSKNLANAKMEMECTDCVLQKSFSCHIVLFSIY